MEKAYRKISLTERSPEEGKPVITIDDVGNAIVYTKTEYGWNMPVIENNHKIEFWLEETDVYTAEQVKGLLKQQKDICARILIEKNGHAVVQDMWDAPEPKITPDGIQPPLPDNCIINPSWDRNGYLNGGTIVKDGIVRGHIDPRGEPGVQGYPGLTEDEFNLFINTDWNSEYFSWTPENAIILCRLKNKGVIQYKSYPSSSSYGCDHQGNTCVSMGGTGRVNYVEQYKDKDYGDNIYSLTEIGQKMIDHAKK